MERVELDLSSDIVYENEALRSVLVSPVDPLDDAVNTADSCSVRDCNLDEALVAPTRGPGILHFPVVGVTSSVLKTTRFLLWARVPPLGDRAIYGRIGSRFGTRSGIWRVTVSVADNNDCVVECFSTSVCELDNT